MKFCDSKLWKLTVLGGKGKGKDGVDMDAFLKTLERSGGLPGSVAKENLSCDQVTDIVWYVRYVISSMIVVLIRLGLENSLCIYIYIYIYTYDIIDYVNYDIRSVTYRIIDYIVWGEPGCPLHLGPA